MAELVVLVLDDPGQVDQVLEAWVSVGVSGVTLLDSAGLEHHLARHASRDDLPLFPSLSALLRTREEQHRTLFTVVPEGFDLEALVAATQRITGDLNDPNTGVLFAVPVSRVWGLNRRMEGGP
jgi:nitrogen regulatory protein P-II 1